VSGYRFIQGQFSQNLAGQLFAELYSPLIERIDFPDDTLYKYFVFVQCDQHTQRCRIEFFEQDRGRGVVARENTVRKQVFHKISASVCAKKFASSMG